MLVKRLQDHILGVIELSTSQVRSIEILLNKTLPNLAATHNTEENAKTLEDWLDELDEPKAEAERAEE